jgi:hypothetical protein
LIDLGGENPILSELLFLMPKNLLHPHPEAVIVARAGIATFSFPRMSRETPSVPFFADVRISLGYRRQHVSSQSTIWLSSW